MVCSDKTGTLTQNKMTVESCFTNQKIFGKKDLGKEEHKEFLKGMTLCNDGVLEGGERIGDPTELALLDLSARFGMRRDELEKEFPRTKELAFDSNRKMMSTFHQRGNQTVTYTKGAPDEVLKKCSSVLLYGRTVPLTEQQRKQIRQAVESMSSQALRTLAIAMRAGGSGPVEEGLTFVGMVGIRIGQAGGSRCGSRFRDAGVSTVMITGDHVDTAFAIGKQLGIVSRPEQCLTGEAVAHLDEERFLQKLDTVRVFARVSPEHKVRIVKGFKAKGNIVAMTGDGVNDAPSLRRRISGLQWE